MIECYYIQCEHHACFNNPNSDDGPFCDRDQCCRTYDELCQFARQRRQMLKEAESNEFLP